MTSASASQQQAAPFLAVPRDRGDEACAVLSPVAFKIWYRITRLTYGWNRDEALISYNDFMRACGIKDRHTVSAAITELINKGFARVVKHITETGRHLVSSFSLIDKPSGNNPLPITPPFSLPTKGVVEKIHQGSVVKSTTPSGKNPVPAPRQPAPAAAPREAIETLIETSIEKEEIASDVQGNLDVAPSARTSEEVRREDVLTLRSEEEEDASLEPAEQRARLENYLERLKAIDPRRLSRIDQITLRNRIRRTERNLEDLSTPSCSPAQVDASTPPAPLEQASIIVEPPRAWLSENQAAIETHAPGADLVSSPPDDSPPAVLFAEAVPPERPFSVVTRLFFREDVTVTDADAREIQSVVNALHEHGIDDPWRIEELYLFWRDRYRDLKRKTMYHFKRYAFQTAQ